MVRAMCGVKRMEKKRTEDLGRVVQSPIKLTQG